MCPVWAAPYASWLVFTRIHLSCSPAVRDKPSSSHDGRTLRQPTSFIIQITLTSQAWCVCLPSWADFRCIRGCVLARSPTANFIGPLWIGTFNFIGQRYINIFGTWVFDHFRFRIIWWLSELLTNVHSLTVRIIFSGWNLCPANKCFMLFIQDSSVCVVSDRLIFLVIISRWMVEV